MIPAIGPSGVMPAFVGTDPTVVQGMSPFSVSLDEVAHALGTSGRRGEILKGLVNYRRELRREGIVDGVQWLDGSFVERRSAEPNDVDVVTFYVLPAADEQALFLRNQRLFDPSSTKANFMVDAYYVNFALLAPLALMQRITYWYGLFSHQRNTSRWKGMVQVPIQSGDDDQSVLDTLTARWHI